MDVEIYMNWHPYTWATNTLLSKTKLVSVCNLQTIPSHFEKRLMTCKRLKHQSFAYLWQSQIHTASWTCVDINACSTALRSLHKILANHCYIVAIGSVTSVNTLTSRAQSWRGIYPYIYILDTYTPIHPIHLYIYIYAGSAWQESENSLLQTAEVDANAHSVLLNKDKCCPPRHMELAWPFFPEGHIRVPFWVAPM